MGRLADGLQLAAAGVDDTSLLKTASLADRFGEQLTILERKYKSLPDTTAPALKRMEAPVNKGGFDLPSSGTETTRNALKWLAVIGGGSVLAAALWKLLQSSSRPPADSSEDIIARLPGVKRASWKDVAFAAAAAPTVADIANVDTFDLPHKLYTRTTGILSRLFAPTGSAWDAPWFLPAALVTLVGGLAGGAKIVNALQRRRKRKEMEEAKAEFERALQEQYEAAHPKSASIGVLADIIADAHITGELDRQAESFVKLADDYDEASVDTDELIKSIDPTKPRPAWYGSGRKALGVYLALLTLIAGLSAGGGYALVRSYQPSRRAIANATWRRRMVETPRIQVEAA